MSYKSKSAFALSLVLGMLLMKGIELFRNKFRSKQKKSLDVIEDKPSEIRQDINSALFFPESEELCLSFHKSGRCVDNNCKLSHNAKVLTCLIKYLNMAKESVDVCVYMFSNFDLARVLLSLHKSGIKIRIITDGTFGDEDRTRIRKFRSEGVAVRSNLREDRLLMHHKFAIVDNALLVNGSFNWTWQAIMRNHENLLITNTPALVTPYVNEFNNLWNKFDPAVQAMQQRLNNS